MITPKKWKCREPHVKGTVQEGPVILTKFLKIALLRVVLDWQKIYKTILEKAFFFNLWCYYLFSAFVLINFKISLLRGENFFS